MHSLDAVLYKWIGEANERRDDLELPVGFIEESVAGLKAALGEQYLEQLLISDNTPIQVLDDEAHPLRKWLLSAHIFSHILQVLELASYLRAFAGDSALADKIVKLKRDAFWPIFFELAMATRAKRACGACESVRLNRETAESVGDFTIAVPGALIPCECSRLGRSSITSPEVLLDSLSNRISDGTERIPVPLCVKIRSTQPLSGSTYNSVLRLVRNGLGDARRLKLPTQHSDGSTTVELEELTSSSEKIPFHFVDGNLVDTRGTDWGFAVRLCRVPARDRAEITRRHKAGETFLEHEAVRLFTQFGREPNEVDPYTRLTAKLNKKLKQTKIGAEHFGKIVLVAVRFDLRIVDEDKLAEAIRAAALRSRNALGIVLAKREQNAQVRYSYSYSGKFNRTATGIRPDVLDLLQRFVNQELSIDPILGLPYRRTWAEAQAHQRELAKSRPRSG